MLLLAVVVTNQVSSNPGDKLTMAQMEFVIREMESIPNPYACVHGRPTVMTITPEELDKKFKRSGF